MSSAPADGDRPENADEAGSALILAMVFLVIGAILVLALANLSGTSLATASTYSSQRSLEYAADGATNAAVEANRYGSSCAAFPGATTALTLNGIPMHVTCAVVTSSASQRTYSFSTCRWVGNACSGTAVLKAEVQYLDVYTSNGVVLPRHGGSLQVLQWDVQTIS